MASIGGSAPDATAYPNVARWFNHISHLQSSDTTGDSTDKAAEKAARKKAKAAEKAARAAKAAEAKAARAAAAAAKQNNSAKQHRKEVVIDILPEPMPDVEERRVAKTTPPPLGAAAHNLVKPGDAEKFYTTTAINYTNGWAHIGHAYEAVAADTLARWNRIFGRDVEFCTGTDEHGQKIAQKAESKGKTPQEICDIYASAFQALNQRLRISNDVYIRTTDHHHMETCQKLWEIVNEKGDIYLDKYTGYYLVREERYVTDAEAKEWEYKDPSTGKPLTEMSEESYFFRMGKYQQRLIDHINSHPDFIKPEQYRQQILARLEEPLRDLSCSRRTFSWGIPIPGSDDHVMYVWFDALTNYLSAVNGLDGENEKSHYWPPNAQIIGKDIIWFHCVIWPCMLMSAGISLPESVAVHGFIQDAEGKKMSKSIGNVVDPHDVLDKFPVDSVRWYMLSDAPYGGDLKFSTSALINTHNADLCNGLGNLVNRAVALSGGSVPDSSVKDLEKPFDLKKAISDIDSLMRGQDAISEGCAIVRQVTGATNEWITRAEPWKIKDDKDKKMAIIRLLMESVYALAHLWAPFIPMGAEKIFEKLDTAPRPLKDLSETFENLEAGHKIPTNRSLIRSGMQRETNNTISEEKVERIRRKMANENSLRQQAGMSIMNDRRVHRGNTYARLAHKGGLGIDAGVIEKEREMQRRKLQQADRARKADEVGRGRRTPDPVANRRHMDIQTDEYYEKLTAMIREHDAETQTPFENDRPPSPLFIPAKSGSDAGTQILDGELFDFDKEVIPILEVVVGRTIERALMEVLEEEELKAIRQRQTEFAALRHAELLEAQRMEGVEQRRSDEKARRVAQEQLRLRVEEVVRRKVMSRQLARHVVGELEAETLRALEKLGKFDDPRMIEVDTKIFPQMMAMAAEEARLRKACSRVTAELVVAACSKRISKFTECRDKWLAGRGAVEDIVSAAEKESKNISDIEELEAARIEEERNLLKSWDAYEDPATPVPEPVEEEGEQVEGEAAEGEGDDVDA
ncbi:methionyl-tRNA synthetase [Perkinsus chesapeaki]|uniref:methionine--tRNA ligase n=1 Tax=Perkinsus chesapeaki TaxID=330153 RepID=A0A7J6M3W1_PERCH|nr:methionyl-tRNA synthetase [Perkinsus chesapeaki]